MVPTCSYYSPLPDCQIDRPEVLWLASDQLTAKSADRHMPSVPGQLRTGDDPRSASDTCRKRFRQTPEFLPHLNASRVPNLGEKAIQSTLAADWRRPAYYNFSIGPSDPRSNAVVLSGEGFYGDKLNTPGSNCQEWMNLLTDVTGLHDLGATSRRGVQSSVPFDVAML